MCSLQNFIYYIKCVNLHFYNIKEKYPPKSYDVTGHGEAMK